MTEREELELIREGKKPMSAFYKVSPGRWYNENRDDFESLVLTKDLSKIRFNIKNDNQRFKITYEVYAQSDNFWRMELYRLIKKIGQERWNADLEAIERILLGYRGMYQVASPEVQQTSDTDT